MLGKAQIKRAEIFETMLDNLWFNKYLPCMIHDTHNSIHTNKTIKDAPVGLACVRVIYPLSCEP